MSERAKKPVPLTESQLVERLRSRYEGESGNGPAGALLPGVRDAAGFDAKRTIDALGFHFWPSRGLLIDAYECKSARSDWLREVEDPAKADRFCALADRFYVVAGRADIVKLDEVPPDWGLLVPHGDKLKEVKPAKVLHADSPAVQEWAERAHSARRGAGPRPLPPGFNRSFLVAIVRQATKVNDTRAALRQERDAGFREGVVSGERSAARELERLRALEQTVREFEQALGYPISGRRSYLGQDVSTTDIGRTLRNILDGDANVRGLRNRLDAAAENAERLATEARARIEALDAALAEVPA